MARSGVTLAALCFAAGVLAPFVLPAQANDSGARGATTAAPAGRGADSTLSADSFALPPLADITEGNRVIATGTTETGTVAIRKGDLEVRGTVTGDAIAVDGNVIVLPGGLVRGSAVAVRGEVRLEGGSVLGEILTTTSEAPPGVPAAPPRSPAEATRHALALAIGWLAVIAVIGIGVLIFGSEYLEGTSTALERRFSRSFWMGVAGQLALLPLLLALIIGLTITLLGILLIPFAVVAYILAVAGVLTLGFLAVARVTGAVLTKPAAPGTARLALLRSLAIGIAIYLGFWIIAAAFAWNSVIHAALSGIAFVVTWVAVTAGLGAAIISRAGTRPVVEPDAAPLPMEEAAWQTPTPIGGVVAARRPTPRVKETR